jgi:hypothetical protein
MKTPELERRTCSLSMVIRQGSQETVYHVRPIDSELHLRAYQVRKDDGTVYHVTQAGSGKIECDCGAATFHERRCKHSRAAYRLGLFLRPREIIALQRLEREKKRQ